MAAPAAWLPTATSTHEAAACAAAATCIPSATTIVVPMNVATSPNVTSNALSATSCCWKNPIVADNADPNAEMACTA